MMDEQGNLEPGKSDHWDLLVSSLGAEPVKAEEQAPEPEIIIQETETPAESEVTTEDTLASLPQATVGAPTPARQKTAQDWARLASELGVEVPPELAEPEETTLAGDSTEVAEPPISVNTLEVDEEWRKEESTEEETDGIALHEEREHRGRRRRKRRRRAGPGAESRGEESAETEDTGEFVREAEGEREPDLAGDLEDSLSLPEDLGEAPIGTSETEPAEEPGPERGKRRRRRRRRPAARDEESTEAMEPAAESEEDLVEHAWTGEGAETEDDRHEVDSEDEHHEDKALHRAIPTWEEAVGIVISTNMESRAKNPDRRSSQRSRGHHRGGHSD